MSNSYVNDFHTSTQIYYQELKKHSKPISREKEIELIKLAKSNNIKARNEILTSNLRFVFDIAKRYKGCGTPLGDLISEGNIGLVRAIDKFDETKNVKFISYAVWWIRQAIQEFLHKNQIISSIEVSEEDEYVKKTSHSDNDSLFDCEDENAYQHGDDVVDEEITDEEKLNAYQKKIVLQLLSKVDERGRQIIEMYYGLNGYKAMSLEEIGLYFQLSKERVRQICKKTFIIFRSEILKNNIDLTI